MTDLAAYLGLFLSAFTSATLLPGSSEVVMTGLIVRGGYPVLTLLLVATAGNLVGAALNWVIGRSVERFRDRKWFPVSPEKLEKAKGWYHRWGRWSLLLSWIPLFGDALTVAAGVMREPLWSFLTLVGIAKGARYVLVAAGTLAVI
ncbi:MAG: DedA family protein [Methylobacterium mesophilicum]|nr:DedA family protein [Methylobacterium mesophilicum]